MFGFSSLNLARLSDEQLCLWDSFLKGLLVLRLHPWKNCEKWMMLWETWVCFQGLSFMLKVVIEECFWIIDVWNVKSSNFCYGKIFFYWRNVSQVKNIFICLLQQPNLCGYFVVLWNDPHVAGLVLCAPAWAGQNKPGQTEPCLLFLWKRLPTSPRDVLLYHSRCSRHELSALLSLGFAFSDKTHFSDFFCKCCFSFSSVSMVCSSLSCQQK